MLKGKVNAVSVNVDTASGKPALLASISITGADLTDVTATGSMALTVVGDHAVSVAQDLITKVGQELALDESLIVTAAAKPATIIPPSDSPVTSPTSTTGLATAPTTIDTATPGNATSPANQTKSQF